MQVVIDIGRAAADNVCNDSSCAVNMHNVTICAGIYKDSRFKFGSGIHSVMDMVCNSSKSGIQLRGCHVNTSVFPCAACAEALISLQISKLVVLNFPNFFLFDRGESGNEVGRELDTVEIYEALDEHKIDVEFYGFPSLTMNLLSRTNSSRIVIFNEIFDEKIMSAMYGKFNHDYYKKRSYETSSCVFSMGGGGGNGGGGSCVAGETTLINGTEHTVYNYTRDLMELKEKFEVITHRRYNMALMIFVDRIDEFYTLIPNSCTLFMTESRYMEFHLEQGEDEESCQQSTVTQPREIMWENMGSEVRGGENKRTVRALLRPGSGVVIQTDEPSLYKPISFNSVKQTRKTIVITFV